MIEALAAIGGIGTAGALVAVIVLAFKLSAAKDAQIHVSDLLGEERHLSDQYKHERDVAVAARDIAEDVTKHERELRQIAEAKLAAAKARVQELLAKHLKEATPDEIAAATAAAFGGVVSVVPKADRPSADDLLDPFADVPDA